MEEHGFLLIADITGYSTFLNESELEHAQQTLTDLLELLLDQSSAPFVFSQLEGDAVFSYALGERPVSSQTFLEQIEDTYVEFRRAIDLMVLNNSCQCNACANVSALDLKFFVHYGSFAIQPVGQRTQLVGSDVNLVHRLLKNTVTADTRVRAYLLATEAAVEALGLDPGAEGMLSHQEAPADFNTTAVWVKDMHPVYEAAQKAERAFFQPEDVLFTLEIEVPVPVEHVWSYANQSDQRDLLFGDESHEVLDRKGDRVGTGSTYLCYHGKMTITQLVLDWRPFDRVVLQQRVPVPGKTPTHTIIEFRFEATADGTRFVQTVTKPTGPALMRALTRVIFLVRSRRIRADTEAFGERITEDYLTSHQPSEEAPRLDLAMVRSAAVESLTAVAATTVEPGGPENPV